MLDIEFFDIGISMLISLMLTIIIEIAISIIAGKRGKDLLLVILVNAITNPIVVLAYNINKYYIGINSIFLTIPLEIFAIIFEGKIYKLYAKNIKNPYIFSLYTNVLSFSIGLLINIIW